MKLKVWKQNLHTHLKKRLAFDHKKYNYLIKAEMYYDSFKKGR